jgi:hypothetical protein
MSKRAIGLARITVIAAEQWRHFRLKARDVRCNESSDFWQSRRVISAAGKNKRLNYGKITSHHD